MSAKRVSFWSNPSGDLPQVDPTAYVSSSASVIGRVQIGPRVYIGPGAVLRADETGDDGRVAPIVIGAKCNVQDGVIIHSLGGCSVKVGAGTSLAHGSIIHGPCTIGEGCFVGFCAVVFKSNVSAGVYISARAVVQGADIPAEKFVNPGQIILAPDQADQLKAVSPADRELMDEVVKTNLELARGYRRVRD